MIRKASLRKDLNKKVEGVMKITVKSVSDRWNNKYNGPNEPVATREQSGVLCFHSR